MSYSLFTPGSYQWDFQQIELKFGKNIITFKKNLLRKVEVWDWCPWIKKEEILYL